MSVIKHHIYQAGDRMEKVGELPSSFDVDTPIEDPSDPRIRELAQAIGPEGVMVEGDYILICEQSAEFSSAMPAFLYHVAIGQPKPRAKISSQGKPVID